MSKAPRITNESLEIPEPGQLVEVRRRIWTAVHIDKDSFDETEGKYHNRQHLVTLSSLEDDSLGEEISIVWEIEPGARILGRVTLPGVTGIDDAEKLSAFLDAVRWGVVTHADHTYLQAPFRSAITIEDYQLDPLVRAIDMARACLLIADDVGLGKTIEAGLVIRELLLRHRAHSVLIVCPASLQIKWKEEMYDKFGLDFRIVDTSYLKWLRRKRGIHVNPWTSYPFLITSIDWAKSGEPLRAMRDVLPIDRTFPRRFGILVVDEAHNIAPTAASRYVLESQRTRFIRMISPHFEHKLFLTATPHNGYQESFTALLELLDERRFARTVVPDRKQLNRIMVRRLKTDLVDAEGNPIYPVRRLMPLEVDYTDEEREVHETLRRYTELRLSNLRDKNQVFGTEFVLKLLKKRLFSSPAAFRRTLMRHVESLKVASPSAELSRRDFKGSILRRLIARAEETYADDEAKELAFDEAVKNSTYVTPPLTKEEQVLLDSMVSWANANAERVDSKAKAILNWIEEYLFDDGRWNDQRVILFTEYLDTHRWLHQILTSHGYGGKYLMVLRGGMDAKEREQIKAAFQAHPDASPVRILLATDAASEGIDLQRYCNKLIHVEIPWNPNVMEQRNGRIDRHGQREKEVYIWHPVGRGVDVEPIENMRDMNRLVADAEFLMRVVVKINRIREDLGCVGAVIAHQIEEMMLGRRKSLDLQPAEDRARSVKRTIRTEYRLRERISRLHERLLQTRKELSLTPERIIRAVQTALSLAGQPPLIPIRVPGVPEGSVFKMPRLQGSWAKCMDGLQHPYTGELRPITFEHDVARDRDDLVLVHLDHPLVQMCLRLLRAEIWAREDVRHLHRVSTGILPVKNINVPMAIAWFRLLVVGGGHHRLHEELTLAGGYLKKDGFTRETRVTLLHRLVSEAQPLTPDEDLLSTLVDRYESCRSALLGAIEARSRDRLRHLRNVLQRSKERDIKDVVGVFDELQMTIEKSLKEYQRELQTNILLWVSVPEERRQLERDIEALRKRLEHIPIEKAKEIDHAAKRYESIEVHTLPVAVVLLVPEFMAEGVKT